MIEPEQAMQSIGSTALWCGFGAVVLAALIVDFMVLRGGGEKKVTFRDSVLWSAAWVALALIFNAALWWYLDGRDGREVANQVGLQFLTGYVIEKSLSIDNIFVFLLLFKSFAVPEEQQRKVLMIGVLGALLLRAIMIFIGAALIARFHWVLYLFGAFLVFTGVRMAMGAADAHDIEQHPLLRWMRRHLRVTPGYRGGALSVHIDGQRWFTPLFLVVVLIGFIDIVFAVDSIPAIFAITEDPFIVLTSNVFAVLGLRALFFMLAGMADRFHLLNYGLAAVLVFIGLKMLIVEFWKIPISLSLLVVAALIGGSMLASAMFPAKRSPDH